MKQEREWKRNPIRFGLLQTRALFVCFFKLSCVTFVFALTPFLLGLLGRYLGHFFGDWQPFFMVLFLVIGFILGGIYAFLELRKLLAES